MNSSMIGPTPNLTQNVKYTGLETEFATEIKGQNVVVHCSEGIHNHGSSKVELKDKIDYNWEFRYYHGHLVAAHVGGKVYAYGMTGKDGAMVRVSNQETDNRTLIKHLKEDIKDVAFAFSRTEIILGCVDSEGNILIHQVEDTPHSVSCTLLLHIFHPPNSSQPKANYKLIWCPYLASFDDDDSNEDPVKMFAVLNGNRVEIFNVTTMTEKYGKGIQLDPDDSYEGYIEILHTAEVVDASFSADGTAIAIASSDGYVKFFQLYMFDTDKQKCLHEWRPHDGKPLSCIIFIDNVMEYSSECWKFTITGANNNSEIKLWSCESWTCLQTIYFKADPSSHITLYLNVSIDYSGQYLVISDINNRVLYILQLERNDKEQIVHVTMLSQFLLPAAFLSSHILEAKSRTVPFSYVNSNEDLYVQEEYDEEAETTVISLKMLVILPKKFQECNIMFQPEALFDVNSSASDAFCEKTEEKEKVPNLDDLQESVSLLIQQQNNSSLTLMTPDDFTNPVHTSRPTSTLNDSSSSVNKPLDELNENVDDNLIDFQRPQKDNFASGGSSPSREVQEILSLNNSTYSTQDYFDNLTKLKDEHEEPQKEYNSQNDMLLFQEGLTWPKIPVVKENDIIKDENLRAEFRLSAGDSAFQIKNITYRVNALEAVIREQNILIQKLHQDRLDKDEFFKELDCAMSKQHLQMAKLLENLFSIQKSKQKEMQEQMVNAIVQLITKSLAEKLQQIMSQETKHVVLPSIHNLIESYRHQIDTQYAQKLNNADIMLKENIAKAFNSKALADTLSVSVVNIIAPSLEKCYRDIISSSLIPSWERVCGQMFQQINETFTKGTKEYTASVESYMDRQRKVQEKGSDLIAEMQAISDNMKMNSDKLSTTLSSEIHKQFGVIFKSMQDKLNHNIKEVVAETVKQSMKSHASAIEDSVINAVRSRAVTPSPNVDTRLKTLSQIQYLLSQHKYEDAIETALSAEDLSCVIFVCEKVDINKLFGKICILQQSCLLALIQQLSNELHKNTELKLSFIRAAFFALSPDNLSSKHFIPKVLKELLKQLSIFIQSAPPVKEMTEAKLLKLAVESMLGK